MKPAVKRSVIVLSICAVCTLAFLYLWARGFDPLRQVEFSVQDWQMRQGRKTPVDDRLVLIGIDKAIYSADFSDEELQAEPALKLLQTDWPWSRALYARLIEKLSAAGAKVIVFDLVSEAPTDGDEAFHEAFEKYKDRVVIGYGINSGTTERGNTSELQLPNPTILPHEEGDAAVQDDRLGYVNFWPDPDNTIRQTIYRQTGAQAGYVVKGQTIMESLDARALRKFGHADDIPAKLDSIRFRYGNAPGYGYKINPIGDVLSPNYWKHNYADGAFFKDKLVLIGPTSAILQDEHDTPFVTPKQMLGPEIQLNVIAAALHHEFFQECSFRAELLIIALGGVLAGALCFVVRHPVQRLFGVVGLSLGYWFLAQLLFDHAGRVIPVASPLMVLISSSVIAFAYDFVLEQLERMKLRHTMGLYFSPRVMEAVLSDPGSMQPRRADVVLLLTDLRNSTPLAETLGPQGMFELLNRVFEVQTNAIMAEEGNLEHFLGDQFLSYWGAPQKQPDAADRAERAAMALITAMEKLRATLTPEVQKLFGYGVALHSGSVLVGNKGSALRLDYGLVGDTVNEAARVEALTKFYAVRMLVTRDAFAQFKTQLMRRLLDRVIVKGKSEPVELYECENPCTPPNYGEICVRYKTAYDEYFFGRFVEAQKQFDALVHDFSDGPSRVLSARCNALQTHPPTNWHGIWKMDAK
jgi:adenylate cyclase